MYPEQEAAGVLDMIYDSIYGSEAEPLLSWKAILFPASGDLNRRLVRESRLIKTQKQQLLTTSMARDICLPKSKKMFDALRLRNRARDVRQPKSWLDNRLENR
jgi:hypothetical protein